MMKQISKLATLFLSIIILLSFSTTPAYAYNIINHQYGADGDYYELKGIRPNNPLVIYAVTGTTPMYITALKIGINTWNNAGYGTLFVYGGEKELTQIDKSDGISTFRVTIGDTFQYEYAHTLGATLPRSNSKNRYLEEADILINANNPLSLDPVGPKKQYDVISVVTHELGHAAGLADTCLNLHDPIAVMNEILVPNNSSFRTLKYDDLVGLNYLYGTGSEDTMIPPTDKPDPDPGFNPDPNPPYEPGGDSSSKPDDEITGGPGRPE